MTLNPTPGGAQLSPPCLQHPVFMDGETPLVQKPRSDSSPLGPAPCSRLREVGHGPAPTMPPAEPGPAARQGCAGAPGPARGPACEPLTQQHCGTTPYRLPSCSPQTERATAPWPAPGEQRGCCPPRQPPPLLLRPPLTAQPPSGHTQTTNKARDSFPVGHRHKRTPRAWFRSEPSSGTHRGWAVPRPGGTRCPGHRWLLHIRPLSLRKSNTSRKAALSEKRAEGNGLAYTQIKMICVTE